MAASPPEDEGRWAADKREFVADSRDDVADEREVIADAREALADARDALADAREVELDAWELSLARRAVELGQDAEDPHAAAERQAARAVRAAAGVERTAAREVRAAAGVERLSQKERRDAASDRRLTEGGPTLLATAFAEIAERLYDAEGYDEVLAKIARAAVETVAGGELASVTLSEDGAYRSAGVTDRRAADVDEEQFRAGEGPCIDALSAPLVSASSFPDERWPVLGSRPADHGVASAASYRLGGNRRGDPAPIGSLNIYAGTPEAFDQVALEVGSVLAAHAALAARAVGERATLENLGDQLQRALLSRDVIGQAKGILIERFKTTPEDAFEMLRRSSQHLNVKLREVARVLTETGELEK